MNIEKFNTACKSPPQIILRSVEVRLWQVPSRVSRPKKVYIFVVIFNEPIFKYYNLSQIKFKIINSSSFLSAYKGSLIS